MAGLARHASQDEWFRGVLLAQLGFDPSLSSIEEWVRARFVYQPELVEIVRAPQFMMREILDEGWFSGDCDDAATFIASILKSYGFPATLRAIRYSHPEEFEHVFVVSSSFVFDPTVPYGTEYEQLESMTEGV